ncbi:MAG: HEAT repeat domain-containing protein [Actinomycetota bacterium]|nr:HEAT repeat domain-containing protein [Actinomycetota bacterium]
MEARHLAAERGLVAPAVAVLTARALGGVPFESLGTTKALLKRFFSVQAWDAAAAESLAAAVGPGEGWWQDQLDDDLVLEFGWIDGRFELRVQGPGDGGDTGAAGSAGETDALAVSFEGDIVPEATPNPRTLAFRTGPISDVDSREYRSAEEADDSRVARLFTAFPELVSVLVARDFVALTVRHPDRWPELLAPVLAVVAEEFSRANDRATSAPAGGGMAAMHGASPAAGRTRSSATRLDRAWRELGGLRVREPADLERVLAASAAPASVYRQVAAGLLGEAPPDVARREWARLVGDPSRTVRRAAVDAVVDAGREELRPLLERALTDTDAWVRWKALRGLAELGATPSRPIIQPLTDDPDFRVRLEAQSALRR